MTTKSNKHIRINKIVWINQLFFSHVTFLSTSEFSIVFNISFLNVNNNSTNRHFPEHILISKYLSILQAFLHSQSHILGFTYSHIYNQLILPTQIDICHDSVFLWITSTFSQSTITLRRFMLNENSCFIYPRHKIKYFYIHTFYFIWNRYPSTWFINNIKNSTTFINTGCHYVKSVHIQSYYGPYWSSLTWSISHRHIHMIQFFSYYQLKNLLKHYPNTMKLHLFHNLLLWIWMFQHRYQIYNYWTHYNVNINKVSFAA